MVSYSFLRGATMVNPTFVSRYYGELRPCCIFINGVEKKKALFHCWDFVSNVVGASLLKGGHLGGTVSYVKGIVELEDGCVILVNPDNIQFLDSKFSEYCFDLKMKKKT